MSDTDVGFKADPSTRKSRSRGGLSSIKRVCNRCRKRKSQSVLRRTVDGRYLVCRVCADPPDVYKGPTGRLTFREYIKLRDLSEQDIEVIREAADAYSDYVKWKNSTSRNRKDRYSGTRADNVLADYAGTRYALAAKLYAATVILALEQ